MKEINKKTVSDIISISDTKRWKPGDIVIISAGTGTGKSFFVKNSLYNYAKENNQKILFLIHRSNCITQFQIEIERDNKTDVIDILTYQKIEYDILYNECHIDYKQYAYIVCDEFHYFVSDADFNNTTDISFTEIMKKNTCIKVLMSATGEAVENFISANIKRKPHKYELAANYDHVSSLTFFYHDEDVDFLADMIISKQEKAIIFLQSVKKAYELFKKFSDHAIFNCSQNNSHYKYVDESKINEMLKNECFEENLLITTSCLDAGANIIDKKVKYIIADITDISSLIQCLGRKRSQCKDDTVSFYIKDINNQRLSGLKQSIKRDIEMAEFLMEHNTQELIKKYPRQIDHNRIIYDDTKINKQKNMSTKKVNYLMLAKKKTTIDLYDTLMKVEHGYCKYIAKYLGFINANNQYTYKIMHKDHSLGSFLQKYVDDKIIMLQLKDRKPLIEKLNIRSKSRKQLKSIDSLNAALKEMNLPYQIVQFMTNRVIDGKNKKFKQAWKIEKLYNVVVEKRCQIRRKAYIIRYAPKKTPLSTALK